MSKRIILTVDDREDEMLNLLLLRYGGKPSAYFRYLLKGAFEREFGSYKSGKITGIVKRDHKIELTDEQFCEQCGMKPYKDSESGMMRCGYQVPGGQFWSVDIENRAVIKGRARQFKLI